MEPTSSAAEPAVPKRSRTRNRRGEGGRLREDIITAAAELLDENGDEHAVTLRSVARKVGIAAPSIYPHFPDQSAIMLAVVQREFAGLERCLRAAADEAGEDPRRRLLAVCHAYLDFARSHPERYRTMFGGVWIPALEDSSLSVEDMATLGMESMALLAGTLGECVAAGAATSTELVADATALWVGLHGLAHQRAVSPSFRWPEDIAERVITSLAHLTEPRS